MNINDRIEHFIKDQRFENFRLREAEFLAVLELIEYGTEIPEIESFMKLLENLTALEMKKVLSKQGISFLSSYFRHETNLGGIFYDKNIKMSPLYYAVLNPTGKIEFLKNFGNSRRYKDHLELEIIGCSINDVINLGSERFFRELIDTYTDIYLVCSDEKLFFTVFNKAATLPAYVMNELVGKVKNFKNKGNTVTRYWERKEISVRVRRHRQNLIIRSPLNFLTEIVKFYD